MSAQSAAVQSAPAAEGAAPEAPANVHSIAPQVAAQTPKRRSKRFILMLALPVLLVAGGAYMYLTGGRYVSTDNAYLEQDRVVITADQSGRLVQANVDENSIVKKGDLLFRIDPEPYELTQRQAHAAVAAARLQVEQLRSTYQQALAEQSSDEQTLAYQQKNFQRQQDLLTRGVASNATFDTAQNSVNLAEQALTQAKVKVAGALTALGGDPNIETDQHPMVQQAMAAEATAALNLKQTSVYAPADGIVAQADRLRVGQYVTNPAMAPTAMMSLVETGTTYIEANFKETDLTHMKVGQKATVTFDAFPDHQYEATVNSIDAGTGSNFSLLPAQNATGNWVKVVQRVPVRLKLDGDVNVSRLRSGLSASVEVDTHYKRAVPGFSAAASE